MSTLAMIKIKIFIFNPFSENTFILYDDTREAIVIDPGCYESHEEKELSDFIKKESLKVVKLINTHSHIDHCLGNKYIQDTYNVPLELHESEIPVLESVSSYAPSYGFDNYQPANSGPLLSEGNEVAFGSSSFSILFVPGHSPGHIALINEKENICISGDVLFQGSIGRTDLPGGNYDVLMDSIKSKLFNLSDSMVVYPGHGPTTTIGEERISNPFCGQNPIA
jgi:glyoxylase-like metal-dependent hydrolase (beta-lactamase superfamily II)